MNQNEKLKVVVIELLDSLSNDIAEFLFDRTGCINDNLSMNYETQIRILIES